MIDVLYVSFNRLKMTKASFEALIANTSWDLVHRLYVYDDESTDGTAEYLGERCERLAGGRIEIDMVFESTYFGGPVAAMNRYLKESTEARQPRRKVVPPEMFAKVDNDFVMPPAWLDDLAFVMENAPELDLLGTEPFMGLDTEPEVGPFGTSPDALERGYTLCSHMGGKGLIRRRAFDDRPMWADGRQGFTQWQHKNEDVTKAWITPDIKSFGLDQLPFEPWISLTEEYVSRGWQRAWGKYSPDSHAYWDWWTAEGPA